MKVIVFGATGTVGRHLVQQSLEKGYHVTAFGRNAGHLTSEFPDAKIIRGDVTNFDDVRHAVAGHDSVFVVLGSGKKRSGTVRSAGTLNIIRAMQETGVRRLICQTTLGCGDSRDNLNFFWKYIMFGWFLKKVFLDHELQETYVKESGLDWTIVRPAAFTNGPKTSNYKYGFSGSEKNVTLKISRADVADFLLKELQSGSYRHQTPGLSY